MLCTEHREQILFVSQGDSYHFKPLCMACLDADPRLRSSHKLPLEQAIMRAQTNLAHHRTAINDVLTPISRRTSLAQQVRQQQEALKQEKQRLIALINERIEREIAQLERRNAHLIRSETQQATQALRRQVKEVEAMMQELKNNPRVLQKALNYSLDELGEELEESGEAQNGVFELYGDVRHDLEISHLAFAPHPTSRKPLKKVMNESPLYFLIDKNQPSTGLLGLFQPREQAVKTYNVSTQNWNRYHCDSPLAQDGCYIQQTKPSRLFWIGGTLDNRPSDRIHILDVETGRQKVLKLCAPRSSCMASLVALPSAPNRPKGILIAGGTGNKGQLLKSCEYLPLQQVDKAFQGKEVDIVPTKHMADCNFGCLGGTLFSYNGSSLVRLGGLGRGPGGGYSVVEVVERIQLSEWLEKGGESPKWRYVELEVPQRDQFQVPKLFQAHQAAIQINPQEVLVIGGHSGGWRGVADSYLISIEEVIVQGRVGNLPPSRQQRLIVRWAGQKPLISGGHFAGVRPILWQGRLYSLQGVGQKGGWRLIEFDMYNWWQTPNAVPH